MDQKNLGESPWYLVIFQPKEGTKRQGVKKLLQKEFEETQQNQFGGFQYLTKKLHVYMATL